MVTTGEPRQRPETVTNMGKTYAIDWNSAPPGAVLFTKESSIFTILEDAKKEPEACERTVCQNGTGESN